MSQYRRFGRKNHFFMGFFSAICLQDNIFIEMGQAQDIVPLYLYLLRKDIIFDRFYFRSSRVMLRQYEEFKIVVIGNDDAKRLEFIQSLRNTNKCQSEDNHSRKSKCVSQSMVHRNVEFKDKYGSSKAFCLAEIPFNEIQKILEQKQSRVIILITDISQMNEAISESKKQNVERLEKMLQKCKQLLHQQKQLLKQDKLTKMILVSTSTENNLRDLQFQFRQYVIKKSFLFYPNNVIIKFQQWNIWKYERNSIQEKNLAEQIRNQLISIINSIPSHSAITEGQQTQLPKRSLINESQKKNDKGNTQKEDTKQCCPCLTQ